MTLPPEAQAAVERAEKARAMDIDSEADSDVLMLAAGWAEANRLLVEMCRGHNARGSDGPCDCPACRYIEEKGLRK